MSPGGYFNTITGQPSDVDAGDDTDVADESNAADESTSSFDEPTPAEAKESARPAAPLKPGWPELKTEAQLAAFRAELAANPWHPGRNDDALMDYFARCQWIVDNKPLDADGHPIDPETGERGELEIVGGDRVFAREPGDNPPIQMPALSEAAQSVGFVWKEQTVTAVTALADASGLPRYHVELFAQELHAAAEHTAATHAAPTIGIEAVEEWTRATGLAELTRLEGAGRAQQTIADAQELVAHLADSGMADLQDVADAITTLGNNPRALIGAARLYRELCNLLPQGPWEQILHGDGKRWAEAQVAGKARAAQVAKADQTPDDYIVSYGGRP